MLNLINEYLQLGVESAGDHSTWSFAVAVLFVGAVILRRQSED